MRRGSERCTIGTGRANVVSHGTGRSTDPSLLDYVSSLRATRPRAVGSTLVTSTRVHAPSIEPTPTPTPTIEPTPTIPPVPMFRFRLESRGDSHEPPHAREHRLVGALARVGGVRRAYPHAPHHQQRGLPRTVRRRHFLHGHARGDGGGRRLRPHSPGASSSSPSPNPRPRVSPPTKTRDSLPSPSFPFAPPRGWNTRGGTRGTHLLALANRRPRGRRGWATTARGTPTGTRGRTSRRRGARVPRRARPGPVRTRRRSRRPSRRDRG